MPALEVERDEVRWGQERVAVRDVHGFVEHHSPWSGQTWLEVRGPGWRVPIDEAYGAARERLREEFPDRPWSSTWGDGRFPSAPLGLPADQVLVVSVIGAVAATILGGLAAGPWGAAAVAVGVLWPLARLRDGLHVGRLGLRIGPPWSGRVPWHEVLEVGVHHRGRTTAVWARTRRGVRTASLPSALLPALRGRLKRVGGLALVERAPGLDERYERWRAGATGVPWGVLLATCAVAWLTPRPWDVLALGLGATAASALLGVAIEARATGWGTGAVLWLTGLYALALGALSLAAGGLVQPLP